MKSYHHIKKQVLQNVTVHINISKIHIMNIDLPHLDKNIYGDNSHWLVIAQNNVSKRVLFQDAITCSILGQHNISHVGIMHAQYPYEILRVNQSGTFLLACISGVGEVLIDGVWKHSFLQP